MRKRTTPPSRTGQAAKLGLCCLLFVCLVLGRGCRCDKNGGKHSHTKPGTTILNEGKHSHTKPGTLILNDGKDCHTKPVTAILVPIGESTPPAVQVGAWMSRRPDGRGSTFPREVIVAIWKDGRVIWSEAEDALRGGPPYFEGSIDPDVLAEFLAEVDNKGWFNDPALRQSYIAPPTRIVCTAAPWTEIIILGDGGKVLYMQSSHELYEDTPNLVAEATAITALDGRDRAQVLAEQPEDYRRFRVIWSELRNRLQELIPAERKIVEGLQFDDLLIEIGEARIVK